MLLLVIGPEGFLQETWDILWGRSGNILKIKEKNMKKAVIDIDNTLWHFCDVLYERLRKINKAIPGPDNWVEWDFWEEYCSKEDFIKAIDEIHLNQDNERYLPYSESRDFLKTLKEHNFYIVVANKRKGKCPPFNS